MGGDGGVIASNRKYMRGAGSADQTADYSQKEKTAESTAEIMTTCFLTKTELHPSHGTVPIVACPYGRLYHKEAAVKALLRRKTHGTDELGSHVRGMSDLYDVRFQWDDSPAAVGSDKGRAVNAVATASCPVTGKALKGAIPAVLVVPGNDDTCNVLSESAFAQLPAHELETEYGPIRRKVRLAPPPALVKEIEERIAKEHAEDALIRKNKKKQSKKDRKEKKRKRNDAADRTTQPSLSSVTAVVAKAGDAAKKSRRQSSNTKAAATVSANPVLSSLFTTSDRKVSDKEKKDRLFAR